MKNKLFIGGIPAETTAIEIAQLIALYAPLENLKLIYDKATKKHKGFGFIEMKTENAAKEVIEKLNGRQLGNYKLSIKLQDEPEARAEQPSQSTPQPKAFKPLKTKRPRIQKAVKL